MPPEDSSRASDRRDTQANFAQTRWTLILQAGGPDSDEARNALEKLCQTYWPPVYAFIRREGIDSHHAKDLTQSFFMRLLQAELVRKVKREDGKFRSYVLAALKNFLCDQHRKDKAKVRGGDREIIPMDEDEAEAKYGPLPTSNPEPLQVFDGIWAAQVIEQVKMRLKEAYASRGRGAVFEALRPCLGARLDPEEYAELAAKLAMDKGTFETNLSRFKQEFGKLLHVVVADTVEEPAQVEDEILYLKTAWAGYVSRQTSADQPH